ncbi:MAG: putative 3-oxoacyl-[acyl-carrier protein] reductase [Candidatus Xenobia bacterium]
MQPVIIVTGASRGLGAAVAEWLGQAGAIVALMARNQDDLEQVARRVEARGGKALVYPIDLSNPEAGALAVQSVIDRCGRLDALVNNAGTIHPIGKLAEVDPAHWHQAVQLNLVSPIRLMQAALPALRQSRGRIVNVSTGAASRPVPSWNAYCATKAGLLLLTATVAAEEPDVVCLSLRPGVVDTDMQGQIREHRHKMPTELADYFHGLKQKGELEPPEVPAQVAAWLALEGHPELSGQLVDYQDPKLRQAAAKRLGASLSQVPA